MRGKFILSILAALILYIAGPLIAGLFGIGDREGPRIYSKDFHTVLYKITYSATHDDKPRIGLGAGERPIFYGVPRTRSRS
jgi:hypothetical protein